MFLSVVVWPVVASGCSGGGGGGGDGVFCRRWATAKKTMAATKKEMMKVKMKKMKRRARLLAPGLLLLPQSK